MKKQTIDNKVMHWLYTQQRLMVFRVEQANIVTYHACYLVDLRTEMPLALGRGLPGDDERVTLVFQYGHDREFSITCDGLYIDNGVVHAEENSSGLSRGPQRAWTITCNVPLPLH